MNKIYYKKQQALKNKTSKTKLFCKDVMHNSKIIKQYLLTTYDKLFDEIQLNPISYFYENIEENDQVKLHLDIDIAIIKKIKDPKRYLATIVASCVSIYNKILKEKYNIVNPKIIVLDASTDQKLSAHIIYTNVHFKSIRHLKEFILLINKAIRDSKHIDCCIYRVGCFRTMLSNKYGKTNTLIFIKGYNYEKPELLKTIFLDSMVTNIGPDSILCDVQIEEQKNIKVKQNNESFRDVQISKKVKDVTMVQFEKNPILNDAESCIRIMNQTRYDDYKYWNIIGLALFNIEPSQNSFNIFDAFSKQSKKYLRSDCVRRWNGYVNSNYPGISLNILKYYAKKDNPILVNNIKFYNVIDFEEKKYKSIKFSYDYIIDIKQTLEEQKDTNIVAKKTIKWITNNEIKIIAINSTYNTGKTSYLASIFNEYSNNFPRILFVSYRKSLSYDLMHNFEKYDFCSYEQGIYDVDRIICQVESLKYLFDNFSETINTYDLVVIDEISSVLNHFISPTINNPEIVFNFLITLINQATKLIVLDGDFDNREYDYISRLGNNIILENEISKNKKNYNFISDINLFDKRLSDDLKDPNKNILLICMSAKTAKQYYNTFTDYDRVLYCGDADDSIKDELRNVEESWKKYKLVIYTGCIESGVNFNIPHFYKQYVILCQNSVSPRALSQMLSRSRQFESYDVDIYVNKLNINRDVSFFNFKEVYDYIKYVKQTKKITNDTLFDIINAHNNIEKNNKLPTLFIPYFLKICDIKKHTYNFLDDKCNNKLKKILGLSQSELLKELEFIGPIKAQEIRDKIYKSKATSLEKSLFEKYNYGIIWGIYKESENHKLVKFEDDFFEKFYGKTRVLLNLRELLDISNNKIYPEIDNNKQKIYDFKSVENRAKNKNVKEILMMLEFNDNMNNIIIDKRNISQDIMRKNIEKLIQKSTFFTDKNAQLLFLKDINIIQKLINNFNKNHHYGRIINFINTYILQNYGLYIKTHKTYKTKQHNTIIICNYELTYIDNINIYK